MKSINYVAGFLFSPKLGRVGLIKKAKPLWMKGLWNAIGGKIEENETSDQAMCREFFEETGVYIDSWIHYCTLKRHTIEDVDSTVYFYTATSLDLSKISTIESNGEEIAALFCKELVDSALGPTMPNLMWLLEMAKSVHENRDRCKMFYVQENYT